MAYTPVELTNGTKTRVTRSAEDEANLRWRGWYATGVPVTVPVFDDRVRDLVEDDASATAVALRAALAPLEALAPRLKARDTQPTSIVTSFQAGHGWTHGSIAMDLNSSIDPAFGTQCIRGTTNGAGGESRIDSPALSPIDFSGALQIGVWMKVSDISRINTIQVRLGSNVGGVGYYQLAAVLNGSRHPMQNDEWCLLKLTRVQQTSIVGTPPALNNITGIKIAVTDKATGSFDFSIGRVELYDNTEYPDGVVTIAFDDTYATMMTAGRPKLDQHGFRATVYTTVERLGLANHATLDDLHRLESVNGWDIAAHAYTIAGHSTQFPNLTPEELDSELRQLKTFMLREGFKGAEHFAYPGGIWDAATEAEVKKYFSSARTLGSAPRRTFPPADPYRLACYQPLGYSTAATVKTNIDNDMAAGNHVQLMFHNLPTSVSDPVIDYPVAAFNEIVDYVATLGVPVKTERELLYGG